jgi:glycosyltransferase involved in cell wall biosynthesis
VKTVAVIPCYRVSTSVCGVIARALLQPEIHGVIVVDDACPDASGALVREKFSADPRVTVLVHAANQGVGGAMLTGYQHAFGDGAELVVKIDGDGQMRPELVNDLVTPIRRRQADYCKGNRFFFPRALTAMPAARLLGNATLSFVSKICSGYWSVMDPTNGFTALHRNAYLLLETGKLSKGYFFESDMLYQLGLINAVVCDVPMPVVYAGEESSLRIPNVLASFPGAFLQRFIKRISYKYFIREFNAASLEIFAGLPLLLLGVGVGAWQWAVNAAADRPTPPGTIIIVALLILIGFQLLLSALNYDISHEPRRPLLENAEFTADGTVARPADV